MLHLGAVSMLAIGVSERGSVLLPSQFHLLFRNTDRDIAGKTSAKTWVIFLGAFLTSNPRVNKVCRLNLAKLAAVISG